MWKLSSLTLALFLLVAPSLAYADVVKQATTLVKENPGKSLGVAGCVALVIFPPAAAWCAATLVAGATIDGDTQRAFKAITK